MDLWCVAGSPLCNGAGWLIWYALPPGGASRPGQVVVRRYGIDVPTLPQVWTLLPAVPKNPRTFGLLRVELATAQPGELFEVEIPELPSQKLFWRTMPSEIGTEGVSFIFSSCFWQDDDRDGHFNSVVQAALKIERPRPAFKLLIGDQIYLDWPIEKDGDGAAKTTADRYWQYWNDPAYRELLLATPNFFLCDDHEFWNDYPEFQIHLARSWTASSRKDWGNVANTFYEVFQIANNGVNDQGKHRRWFELKLSPVSIFVSDTRSFRSEVDVAAPQFIDAEQFAALESWQQNLKGPGILVLGQPLFQSDGDFRDHSFSNFTQNYDRLLALIERSLRGENANRVPHDILILSGDIHTGRHVRAWVPLPNSPRGSAEVHELIASPASCLLSGNLTERDPVLPPSTIPPTPKPGRVPWKIDLGTRPSWFGSLFGGGEVPSKDVHFTTIDNNLGVLRLFRSLKNSGGIRVEFCSYLVRPARKPVSHFLSSQDQADFSNPHRLRRYETQLELR